MISHSSFPLPPARSHSAFRVAGHLQTRAICFMPVLHMNSWTIPTMSLRQQIVQATQFRRPILFPSRAPTKPLHLLIILLHFILRTTGSYNRKCLRRRRSMESGFRFIIRSSSWQEILRWSFLLSSTILITIRRSHFCLDRAVSIRAVKGSVCGYHHSSHWGSPSLLSSWSSSWFCISQLCIVCSLEMRVVGFKRSATSVLGSLINWEKTNLILW